MSAQESQPAASAFRRSTAALAAAPIQNCFIPLIVVVLPVIAIFSVSLIPYSHSSIRDFISSLPVSFSPTSPPEVPKSTDHHRLNIDSVLNYSSLLDLAKVDAEEPIIRRDINHLLNVGKMIWRRFPTLTDLDLDPNSFRRLHARALPIVHFWSSRRFSGEARRPEVILSELLGFIRRKKKYSSCAVVGNSGILLDADRGAEIDSHAAVIRLNNAAAGGNISRHVGRKTTISFVNSNVLHDCARRPRCFCHPYSADVPVVFYICQPLHLLYYISCNEAAAADGLGPFLVTDPGFDRICGRIAKYYSLKRWFAAGATLEAWSEAHQGRYFHYSSGMQAVIMAVGVCERVSLFGFGKAAKHHYHTSQKEELKLHDYEAEYEFYKDLMVSPELIPFLSSSPEDGGVKFKFPPVVIRH